MKWLLRDFCGVATRSHDTTSWTQAYTKLKTKVFRIRAVVWQSLRNLAEVFCRPVEPSSHIPTKIGAYFQSVWGRGCPKIDFCPCRVHIGAPHTYIPRNSMEFRDESNGTSPEVWNPDLPNKKNVFFYLVFEFGGIERKFWTYFENVLS